MRILVLTLLTLCLLIATPAPAEAQVKIGYTNIELVLAYMPEARALEQTLSTYQKRLGEQLSVKQSYAKGKLEDYMAKSERGMDPTAKQEAENELQRLDQEIQTFAQEAEQNMLAKRQELLEPVLEKLQAAIDAVAAEQGYTYILNQSTGSGVSVLLHGPEEADITEALMKKLGIEL